MARKTPTPQKELLKRDQLRVQRLEAQLQAKQLRAALSYYTAADTGRRNRDWQANQSSADQAIIPDGLITAARARMTVANTSVGAAAVRSQKRNVVGRGIMVVPVAKGTDGQELTDLNRIVGDLWMRWASSVRCDLEQKRTYWQIQRMTVSEEFITGMSLLVWSYLPGQKNVGLQLQVFEYEQLNRNIQSYTGLTGGQVFTNEVRGGVEIDENGAAVAYHFYRRNPNDYSFRSNFESIRVESRRVMPYFDAERVQQSIGISRFAPILQDVRDQARIINATNSRAYMESCIGMGIEKPLATIGSAPLTVPRRAGDTGTTPSGMRTVDFTPGMMVELMPGEKLTPLMPTTPGSMFQPFTELMHRMIGAGMGMSYGALTRKNDGNYSAARQDMLEDEREIGPQQDMLIDHQVMPTYELFYQLGVLEGRIPVSLQEYKSDPERFHEAEYIPPARPWIDPEKEANAYKVAIEQRIITRKEIVAMRGGRFANMIRTISEEKREAKEVGITFPEDEVIAGPPKADGTPPADAAKMSARLVAAPNYRPLNDPKMNCGNCQYFQDGLCTAYDFSPTPGNVCDSFEPAAPQAESASTMKFLPPGPQDGDRGIDRRPDPAASDVKPL